MHAPPLGHCTWTHTRAQQSKCVWGLFEQLFEAAQARAQAHTSQWSLALAGEGARACASSFAVGPAYRTPTHPCCGLTPCVHVCCRPPDSIRQPSTLPPLMRSMDGEDYHPSDGWHERPHFLRKEQLWRRICEEARQVDELEGSRWTSTCTRTWGHVNTHSAHARTHAYIPMRTFARTQAREHTLPCTHNTSTNARAQVRTHKHTNRHAQCKHMYACTHLHTAQGARLEEWRDDVSMCVHARLRTHVGIKVVQDLGTV